jgi:hypothetical protein
MDRASLWGRLCALHCTLPRPGQTTRELGGDCESLARLLPHLRVDYVEFRPHVARTGWDRMTGTMLSDQGVAPRLGVTPLSPCMPLPYPSAVMMSRCTHRKVLTGVPYETLARGQTCFRGHTPCRSDDDVGRDNAPRYPDPRYRRLDPWSTCSRCNTVDAVACRACACRCLGAPVFGDAGAHRRYAVIHSSDVVGSSQRTGRSGDCLGRLFWRGLLAAMPVAAVLWWCQLVRCCTPHRCRVIEQSPCVCNQHLTTAAPRTGCSADAPQPASKAERWVAIRRRLYGDR